MKTLVILMVSSSAGTTSRALLKPVDRCQFTTAEYLVLLQRQLNFTTFASMPFHFILFFFKLGTSVAKYGICCQECLFASSSRYKTHICTFAVIFAGNSTIIQSEKNVIGACITGRFPICSSVAVLHRNRKLFCYVELLKKFWYTRSCVARQGHDSGALSESSVPVTARSSS